MVQRERERGRARERKKERKREKERELFSRLNRWRLRHSSDLTPLGLLSKQCAHGRIGPNGAGQGTWSRDVLGPEYLPVQAGPDLRGADPAPEGLRQLEHLVLPWRRQPLRVVDFPFHLGLRVGAAEFAATGRDPWIWQGVCAGSWNGLCSVDLPVNVGLWVALG